MIQKKLFVYFLCVGVRIFNFNISFFYSKKYKVMCDDYKYVDIVYMLVNEVLVFYDDFDEQIF